MAISKEIPTHLIEKIKKFVRISVENNGRTVTTKEAMKLFGYSENSNPDIVLARLFLQYRGYKHPKTLWIIKAKTIFDARTTNLYRNYKWHYMIVDREEYKHRITWYKLIEHGGWL